MPIDHLDLSENPTQDSIAAIIGEELMTKLSVELGGKTLFIPANSGPNSPMAVAIGIDAAQKVSAVYGGMYYAIPVNRGNRFLIIQEYLAGTPKARIAPKLKITRSTVYKAIEEYEFSKQSHLWND